MDIDRKSIHIGMIHKLDRAGLSTKIWVEDVGQNGKLNFDQLEQAAQVGESLEKPAVQSQKLGFPETYKIVLS